MLNKLRVTADYRVLERHKTSLSVPEVCIALCIQRL